MFSYLLQKRSIVVFIQLYLKQYGFVDFVVNRNLLSRLLLLPVSLPCSFTSSSPGTLSSMFAPNLLSCSPIMFGERVLVLGVFPCIFVASIGSWFKELDGNLTQLITLILGS